MPNPVAVSAGIIALSMAVAAAIVVYESPELRRMADDLRRRIAIALQSMGDSIAPDDLQNADREPVFNRPEDAEGFLLSRSGRRAETGDPGVDADDESRRRQRDELLYWNRIRLEKQQQEEQEQRGQTQGASQERWNPREALEAMQRATREAASAAGIQLPASFGGGAQPQQQQEQRPPVPPKTSFDGILLPDLRPDPGAADRGTYVVNTGADVAGQAANRELVRRRRWQAAVLASNGLAAAAATYANPFGDEYGIELDEQHLAGLVASTQESTPALRETAFASSAYLAPDREDVLSDLYNASEPDSLAANNKKTFGIDDLGTMDGVFDPDPPFQAPAIPPSSQRSDSGVLVSEVYFDADDTAAATTAATGTTGTVAGSAASSLLLEPRAPVDHDEILPASAADNGHVYSSIQAWAQTSSSSAAGFYSPLPATPTLSVAMSEPEIVSSNGDRTPVESVSTFWGDDTAAVAAGPAAEPAATAPAAVQDDAVSQISAAESRDYEVVSDDGSSEKSVMTPTSWSEVGSVMTESDAGMAQAGLA